MPDDLVSEIRELRRRLDDLERGRISTNFEQRTIQWVSPVSGSPILTVGQTNPPAANRGIFVGTHDGGTIFETDEQVGITGKAVTLAPWRDVTARTAVTSGGYTELYETSTLTGWNAGQITFEVDIEVPSGSTLGVAAYLEEPPAAAGILGSAHTVAGPYTGTLTFTWPSLDPGSSGPAVLTLRAARTAGAGTCYVSEPRPVAVVWTGGGSGWS